MSLQKHQLFPLWTDITRDIDKIGGGEPHVSVAVVVGIGVCMIVIGFLLGFASGIYVYRKLRSSNGNRQSAQMTHNVIKNIPNKTLQGDSYAELNLADIQSY